MDTLKSIAVVPTRRGGKAVAPRPVSDSQVAPVRQELVHLFNHALSGSRSITVKKLHLYRLGDRVTMSSGSRHNNRLSGACTIMKLLPSERGELKYKVQGDLESYERIVDEGDLDAITDAQAV